MSCGERILKLFGRKKISRCKCTMRNLSAFILQLIPQTTIRSCGSYVTLHENNFPYVVNNLIKEIHLKTDV